MGIDLDFSQIHEIDGSKQNGFEELVCQIAHLKKPENADIFVRKEGQGGDAGVECFWRLKNRDEYAWQAKYFLEPLTSSQWGQISASVETALDKHRKLVRYYICIPRDLTDSRKVTSGKKVISAFDTWDDYVKKWTTLSLQKGMNVEFFLWGKHELRLLLLNDKPEYVGKILFWFHQAAVSSDKLKNIILRSRDSLGERFTPEFNVDLPIFQRLACISGGAKWKETIKNQLSKMYDIKLHIAALKHEKLISMFILQLDNILQAYSSLYIVALNFENDDNILFENLNDYQKKTAEIIAWCNDIDEVLYQRYSSDEKKREQYNTASFTIRRLIRELGEVTEFFCNVDLITGQKRVLLLKGEAGSGKSHLLCDFSMKRMDDGLPTVFILGQHYNGGNPIEFIANELNLVGYDNGAVLGALDAAREANNCRTLIVIDAINEGNNRADWFNHIQSFLTSCKQFKHIAIILSCRSTYVSYLLPETVVNSIPQIKHEGFKGHEHKH